MAHDNIQPNEAEDFFSAMEAQMRPSIDEQRERVAILMSCFHREWAESGLLTKVYDAIPEEMVDGSMSLRRRMHRRADNLDATELYIHVSMNHAPAPTRWHNVSVAQLLSGLVMPNTECKFDDADAVLVFKQAATIDGLRREAVLPDLAGNFIDMRDVC